MVHQIKIFKQTEEQEINSFLSKIPQSRVFNVLTTNNSVVVHYLGEMQAKEEKQLQDVEEAK